MEAQAWEGGRDRRPRREGDRDRASIPVRRAQSYSPAHLGYGAKNWGRPGEREDSAEIIVHMVTQGVP